MLERLHKRMNKEEQEGFTLIELLVVIIIIGILAAIAIPVFLSQKSKGYEASMKSDLRSTAQDIEAFNVDQQNYTTVPFGAATLNTAGTAITGTAQTVGTDTLNLSNGNTITVLKSTSNGYCVKATSSKTSAVWYYGNEVGGLASADCTAATT
jgi:type IV pilus assembly protein PilA